MTQPLKQLCRTISSRVEEADSLSLEVREFARAANLGDLCFPVELLARETLINAVVHGNGKVADKRVELTISIGVEWVRLRVADQGSGFGWRRALRKELESKQSSGRGLQLCALYADRVQFNRSGNQITLWMRKTVGKDVRRMAKYVTKLVGQQGSVTLQGDLTAIVVPKIQVDIKQMLSKGARELVFDLSKTTMLDSSGMGLLIAAANSLSSQGGNIRVTNVEPAIFRLLQSMRLTARLNVSARA